MPGNEAYRHIYDSILFRISPVPMLLPVDHHSWLVIVTYEDENYADSEKSLTYQYIRTLIHRPAVGSSLGAKASSSIVALANASKRTLQIIQLLEERRMSFSFCLNKNELLLLSGFGLLYQGLDINRKGRLMQDSQRLVYSIMTILDRTGAYGSTEFKKMACAMISIDKPSKSIQAVQANAPLRKTSNDVKETPSTKPKTARKQLQAVASRFSTSAVKKEDHIERRDTAPTRGAKAGRFARSDTQLNVRPAIAQPNGLPPDDQSKRQSISVAASMLDVPNLDYLSFGDDGDPTPSYPNINTEDPSKRLNFAQSTDCLTSPSLSVPFHNGFASTDGLGGCIAQSPSTGQFDWGADIWTLPADMSSQPAAQSVLSFTEEELTSGEEWSIHDSNSEYRGIAMPNNDGFGLERFDEYFGV